MNGKPSVEPEQPAPGMPTLGMLVPEFPSQTHAFFWREVLAWRELGALVHLLSTRRPPPDACRHDFADTARRETHYLFPPRLAPAATRLLIHPLRATRAGAYVAALAESSGRQKAKAVGLLPSAADLVAFCRKHGIGHVHCHSFADAAHLCAMARRLGGPGYSLTLHGDLPVYGVDHRAKLADCAAVTTAGPHLVESVVALGYPRERILSNPMGVDTTRFTPDESRLAGNATLKLITVARLNANKGHRFALAAIRDLVGAGVDLAYTIVGEGPNRAAIEADVMRLGLVDHVHLLGARGEADVLGLLRGHDVFLLPSVGLGEAAPVSVMEAMSCGLPVVASVIGSTPEMIREGETGFLVPQEDVAALARALRTLADDRVRLAAMGRAAREYAVAHFDSRASALRLLDHIRCWQSARLRVR